MIILERLEQLKKDDFYITHKALGKTQMLKDFDVVRVVEGTKFIHGSYIRKPRRINFMNNIRKILI